MAETAPPVPSATRYELFDELARGGMARVHLGRALGAVGFARTVAVKRLHRAQGDEPELVAMLVDEARLLTRVRHPNVVPIVDVIEQDGELLLAMEYVHGETLARLARACPAGRLPPAVAATALAGALHGLHAAHEARDEQGVALGLVHRDVSPQNIMVGTDGLARVLDFGIAKAAQRSQITQQGHIKGKYAYMAPEQLRRGAVDRRVDVFAAAAVLWELLTGRQLFGADNPAAVMAAVMSRPIEAPGLVVEGLPPALDAVVLKGLEREPGARYASAREMALAIERAVPFASTVEIGAWVETAAAESLASRSRVIARAELATSQARPVPPSPPSMSKSGAPGVARASSRPDAPGVARASSQPDAPGVARASSQPDAPGVVRASSRPDAPAEAAPSWADASPLARSDTWANPPAPASLADGPTALSLTRNAPLSPDRTGATPGLSTPSGSARWGLALVLPIAAGFALTLLLVGRGTSFGVLDRAANAPRQPNAIAATPPASPPNAGAPVSPLREGEPATSPPLGAPGSSAPLAKAEGPAAAVRAGAAPSASEAPKAARTGTGTTTGTGRAAPRPQPARRAPAAEPAPPPDSCSPPYSIEDGIRVLKPHCI